MNTRKLILLFTALVGLAASAFAQTKNTEATVARVTGSATVTLPDGSSVPLTAGMKVGQGSTITTGADGDVYLESHAGYLTSIKADSTVLVEEISVTSDNGMVKEERTLLDLKSGNLVANLDPKKKSVNNYAVRTPKGVAAARGTTFTMEYRGQKVTIAVVGGVVSVIAPRMFNPTWMGARASGVNTSSDSSSQERTVSAGNFLQSAQAVFDSSLGITTFNNADGDARAIVGAGKALEQANMIRELMALAVATVTVAAQNGIGGTTAKEAADVAAAVFKAVPGAAEQAGALIKASNDADKTTKTPAQVQAAADALKAVTDATPAEAKAAFTSGTTTGTFTKTTGSTTTTTTIEVGGETSFDDQTRKTTTATTETTKPTPIDTTTISRSN